MVQLVEVGRLKARAKQLRGRLQSNEALEEIPYILTSMADMVANLETRLWELEHQRDEADKIEEENPGLFQRLRRKLCHQYQPE